MVFLKSWRVLHQEHGGYAVETSLCQEENKFS